MAPGKRLSPKRKRPKRPIVYRPRQRPVKIRTVALVPHNIPLIGLNVVIVGQVVVRSPARYTHCDGEIQGIVHKAYRLTEAAPEVTAGTSTRIGLRLELTGRRVDVRWGSGGGTWSPWSTIVTW